MGQATIILEKEEIKKMKTYYYNYLEKSPQGAIFRARTDNAVITAYRSGKILFQGNNIDTEINKWKKGHGIPKNTSTIKRKTANTSSYIQIVEKEEIKKMKTYYYNYLEKSPQGAIFRARTDNAVITAYRSGKILFQGNNIDTEINKWKKGHGIPKNTSTIKRKTANTSSYI